MGFEYPVKACRRSDLPTELSPMTTLIPFDNGTLCVTPLCVKHISGNVNRVAEKKLSTTFILLRSVIAMTNPLKVGKHFAKVYGKSVIISSGVSEG